MLIVMFFWIFLIGALVLQVVSFAVQAPILPCFALIYLTDCYAAAFAAKGALQRARDAIEVALVHW